MRNPYTAGGIVRGKNFYGRQALIEQLLDSNQACVYLVGNRRIGKTSLLHCLEDRWITANTDLAGGTRKISIFLSLQGYGSNDAKMGSDLLQTAISRFEAHPKLRARLNEADKKKDYKLSHVVGLLNQVAERGQIEILLLLDEAEGLLSLEPKELDRLHRTVEELGFVRIIVAATRKLAVLVTRANAQNTSPFLSGFHIIYLPGLNDEEARHLIRQDQNSAGRLVVSRELEDQICELTGCHPFLIQTLCLRLFQSNGSLRSIVEMDKALELQSESFCWIEYEIFSPTERAILHCLAQAGPFDPKTLAMQVHESPEATLNYLNTLERLGTVKSQGGYYQVSNYFMKSWLKLQTPNQGTWPIPITDSTSQVVAREAGSGAPSHESLDRIQEELGQLRAAKRKTIDKLLEALSQSELDAEDAKQMMLRLQAWAGEVQTSGQQLNPEVRAKLETLSKHTADVTDYFQLAIPIIPGILSYNVDLGSQHQLDLKAILNKFKAKIKAKGKRKSAKPVSEK